MEDGLALLDERRGRFVMILSRARPRVMPGLQVEQLLERAGLGRVEIALHVPVADAGAAGEPPGEPERFVFELSIRDYPVHESDRQGSLGVQQLGREVQLARLGRTDEMGEAVGAAEVACRSPKLRPAGKWLICRL
jgi:hypothetical protein